MRTAPWMVLIGPACAGKTTLGELLAGMTGRSFADIDTAGEAYHAEAGWTMERLRDRIAAVGQLAVEREWEPARAYAVEQIMAGHPGEIVSFGAGHSHYERPELFERVRAALTPVPHVVLILPSPDAELSVRILRARSLADTGRDWVEDGHDLMREWVISPANRTLATATLYTEGEDPQQSAIRLLAMCE